MSSFMIKKLSFAVFTSTLLSIGFQTVAGAQVTVTTIPLPPPRVPFTIAPRVKYPLARMKAGEVVETFKMISPTTALESSQSGFQLIDIVGGKLGVVTTLPETTGSVLDATSTKNFLYMLTGDGYDVSVFKKPLKNGNWKQVASMQSRSPARSGGISADGATIAFSVGFGRVQGLDADFFFTRNSGQTWSGPFDSPSLNRPTIGEADDLLFDVDLSDHRLDPTSEMGAKSFQGQDLRRFDMKSNHFAVDPEIDRQVRNREPIRYTFASSEWDSGVISHVMTPASARTIGAKGAKSQQLPSGVPLRLHEQPATVYLTEQSVLTSNGLTTSKVADLAFPAGRKNGVATDHTILGGSVGETIWVTTSTTRCAKKQCTGQTATYISYNSGDSWIQLQ